MTTDPMLPLAEVTRRAIGVLVRELGPADAARFMAQFTGGSGDYTAERQALFAGRNVTELAADIRAVVASGRMTPPPTADGG